MTADTEVSSHGSGGHLTPLRTVTPPVRPLEYRLRSGDILFFLHIPGTNGDCLTRALVRRYPPDTVCDLPFWPRRPGDVEWKGLRQMRLLVGHLDYELYRCLPRTPVYVTMLRGPVDRVVSLYEHICRTPSHPLHEEVHGRGLTLHDFVTDPDYDIDVVNVQTRRIAGSMFRDRESLSDRTWLEMAIVNLGEFAFFGLADRIRESLLLLAYTFSWPFEDVEPAEGASQPTPDRPALPSTILDAIRQRTHLDRELFDHASALFQSRLAQMGDTLLERKRARAGTPASRHDESPAVYQAITRIRRRLLPRGTRRDIAYWRFRHFIARPRASEMTRHPGTADAQAIPSSYPHDIAIFGPHKGGTTALFYRVRNSLPVMPHGYFEPMEMTPIEEAELQCRARNRPASTPRLAKVMLVPSDAPGHAVYRSFLGFEKRILLLRDPRDRMISEVLFFVQECTQIYEDPVLLHRLIRILRQKERRPQSVSFLSFWLAMATTGVSPQKTMSDITQYLRNQYAWLLEFDRACGGLHRLGYEDMVDGRLESLEAYLGVSLKGSSAVDEVHDHVTRTRSSGYWRDWLTPEDVDFFKPILQDYILAYGYPADWDLSEHPRIPAEHGTEYLRRVLLKRGVDLRWIPLRSHASRARVFLRTHLQRPRGPR